MTRHRGFLRAVLPLIIYCALVFVLSSISDLPTPSFGVTWSDKIAHASEYAVLQAFAVRAARWLMPQATLGTQILVAAMFGGLYAASDEWHQSFVPGRTCELSDCIADSAGILISS